MKIAVGSDHGGYPLIPVVIDELPANGHAVVDCGAFSYDAGDDYPDFAKAVALALQRGEAEHGVVLCGSGVGACVAVNRSLARWPAEEMRDRVGIEVRRSQWQS